MVEHHLAMVGVAGSNPVSRFDIEKISKKLLTNGLRFAIIIFALERAAIVSNETKK